jgi:8-oxo-dGTP pyrophosphatase MutT (NUDIX family)
VVIVPVAGTMKRGEDPVAVAKLECLQETGIELERVEILNGPMGISARKSTEFVVLCVGSPKLPIQRQPPRPDQDEHMAVFLMPWRDLFDLIVLDAIVDEQMLAITYCALHRLDKIGFI